MAITSMRCPVLGARISRVTNLEGEVTHVICAEYEERTGLCRLHQRAYEGGPLGQFLERASDETLATRTMACQFGPR
jgi:hypothetical protein